MPLAAVVVTHWHYDHAFGLAAFADLPTIAHETVRARLGRPPQADVEAARLGFEPAELAAAQPRELVVADGVDLGGPAGRDRPPRRGPHRRRPGRGRPRRRPGRSPATWSSLPAHRRSGRLACPDEWAVTLDGVIGLMTAQHPRRARARRPGRPGVRLRAARPDGGRGRGLPGRSGRGTCRAVEVAAGLAIQGPDRGDQSNSRAGTMVNGYGSSRSSAASPDPSPATRRHRLVAPRRSCSGHPDQPPSRTGSRPLRSVSASASGRSGGCSG